MDVSHCFVKVHTGPRVRAARVTPSCAGMDSESSVRQPIGEEGLSPDPVQPFSHSLPLTATTIDPPEPPSVTAFPNGKGRVGSGRFAGVNSCPRRLLGALATRVSRHRYIFPGRWRKMAHPPRHPAPRHLSLQARARQGRSLWVAFCAAAARHRRLRHRRSERREGAARRVEVKQAQACPTSLGGGNRSSCPIQAV